VSVFVKTTYMRHSGGTKFYEVTLVGRADRPHTAVSFFRWGKNGTTGEGQIETGNIGSMTERNTKQLRAKGSPRKGYIADRETTLEFKDKISLRGHLQSIHPNLNFERAYVMAWNIMTDGMDDQQPDRLTLDPGPNNDFKPVAPEPEAIPAGYGSW
jgi:hypothetical protein